MSLRSPKLQDIKIASVIHHPVQAKNLSFNSNILKFYIVNQIYLIIFHPNPMVIFVK